MATQTPPPTIAELRDKYTQLGLGNLDRFVTGTGAKQKFDEIAAQKAVISEIYKLKPESFTDKKGNINFTAATDKYNFELPKLAFRQATNFVDAVNAFNTITSRVRDLGVENINKTDRETIRKLATQVRDYDSEDLGPNARQVVRNIGDAESAINSVLKQIETVRIQDLRSKGLDKDGLTKLRVDKKAELNRLFTEQDTLRRLTADTNEAVPSLAESLTRLGVTDVVSRRGAPDQRVGQVDSGLAGLSGDRVFGQSSLLGRLNNQVTDDQIRADLANTRRTQAESVYRLGNEALVDLNSQLEQANAFKATLAAGDPRLKSTQATIDRLSKDISDVTSDTNAAKSIFDNPGDIGTDTIASFRETLRLPEERALDQIRAIDPAMLDSARGISNQFRELASTPLGATQDARTEELRGAIEDEALNQLRLGSTLDQEVRRNVEQGVRAAQTARGNIFGVGPAVEEAMQTGLAGEQRKLARYGAAAQFLGSGQSRGDAAARNTSLTQALNLSRLGAANEFIAGGVSPYNLANQRVANQNANFLNYINANNAATGGFGQAANQVQPYQFVNPSAGFEGANTAASIYNSMQSAQASMYGSQVGAIASSYRSPAQSFGQIASGIGSIAGTFAPGGFFGGPASNAIFRV